MEDDELIVLDPMTYEVKIHPASGEHEKIAARFRFWLNGELKQIRACNSWWEQQREEERKHQKIELQKLKEQQGAKEAASTTSTDLESKEADDPIIREGADQEWVKLCKIAWKEDPNCLGLHFKPWSYHAAICEKALAR